MKLMKKIMGFGMAMTMMVGMSAVSYAQFPFNMMIATTSPITMQENSYQLSLDDAIIKHTVQTARALSLPEQEKIGQNPQFSFYPGDTLYIPIMNTQTAELYSEKTRPSNWNFEVSGFDPQIVSDVRWANENGMLNVAVDFVPAIPSSQTMYVNGEISLYDEQDFLTVDTLSVAASFGNVTKEVIPSVVNEVVSPMNLYVGEMYKGETVTLSFGNNVLLKNAVFSQGTAMYLNLDQSFDSEIANRYRSFDIQCYHFLGDEDNFSQPAQLCLPVLPTDSYVYEVVDDQLRAIQTEYDEENNQICFTVDSLGYYIVSPILMQE